MTCWILKKKPTDVILSKSVVLCSPALTVLRNFTWQNNIFVGCINWNTRGTSSPSFHFKITIWKHARRLSSCLFFIQNVGTVGRYEVSFFHHKYSWIPINDYKHWTLIFDLQKCCTKIWNIIVGYLSPDQHWYATAYQQSTPARRALISIVLFVFVRNTHHNHIIVSGFLSI